MTLSRDRPNGSVGLDRAPSSLVRRQSTAPSVRALPAHALMHVQDIARAHSRAHGQTRAPTSPCSPAERIPSLVWAVE
jgi:hypothetical protein